MPSVLDQYRIVYNRVWDPVTLTWVNQTLGARSPVTYSAPTTATIGTTSGQAIASNANRAGLQIVNLSSNTMSFGFGATAVLGSGLTLLPGAAWRMPPEEFTTAAINAIATGASSTLAIQEMTV